MDAHPWAWVGFVVWVIITAFFVLNLMIAVICESLIELQNMGEEKRQNKALKDQKNLINNQTEHLMEETRKVLELQTQMLANQLAMQEILLDIATVTSVVPVTEVPAKDCAKTRLQRMIDASENSAEIENGDET